MRMWIVMGAATLAGCAAETIEGADDYLPTISFDLQHRDEVEQAEGRADTWCRDNFDRRARLVSETDYNDADNRVTFECFVD
jgi:hypothetical protein